jgi:hypothetical protein
MQIIQQMRLLPRAAAVWKAPPESARDMKYIRSEDRLDRVAGRFAELHEQNRKALRDGEYILSHEITSQIQQLLVHFEIEINQRRIPETGRKSWRRSPSQRRIPETGRRYWRSPSLIQILYGLFKIEINQRRTLETGETYRAPLGGLISKGIDNVPVPGDLWWYVTQYPGPLPESLKERPNQAVLMWKRDEEERTSLAEEARRRAEEERRKQEAQQQPRKAESEKQGAMLAALQQAAITKGLLKPGDRCPKCGFSYAWDGMDCHHCHYNKA